MCSLLCFLDNIRVFNHIWMLYIYICIYKLAHFSGFYVVRCCVVPRGKPLFLVIGSGPAVGDLRRPTITRCCQQEIASVAEHISLGLLRQDLARNRTTSSKIGDVQRLQYLGLPGLNGRHKKWFKPYSLFLQIDHIH